MLEKLDSQNVYFLHIRNGINSLVKALTNLQWTAEELRTGGKEGKSGEVSSKGGSLISTVCPCPIDINRPPLMLLHQVLRCCLKVHHLVMRRRQILTPLETIFASRTGRKPWGDEGLRSMYVL